MLVMQISTKAQEGQKLGRNLGVFLHVISYYTTFNSVGPGPPRVHVSEVEEDASGPSPPKPLEESYNRTTAGTMSRNVKNLISRKYRTTMSHLS